MKKFYSLVLVFILILGLSVSVFASDGKYGGTLIVGRGSDSVGLDAANVTDGESQKVMRQIYDTLTRYKPGTTEVIPGVAKSWEVSNDAKTWVFKLREGVKFHDGTVLNAESVKFNFDRWQYNDHPYHNGTFGYYTYMFGGYDDESVIKEIIAIDEYTVKFELRKPMAPFLSNLAMTIFPIASPTAIKKWGEDFFKHPVGSGPFEFVEWKMGERIVLKANEDYWDGRPYVDKLVYRSIPDNSARYMELQTGAIDVMTGLSPEDVEGVRNKEDMKVILRPSFNIGYFAMNFAKEPFDDIKVRKAFAHAINKEEIINAFYAGLAVPAKNPMPPSLWGYNDEIDDYEYNPEKAKELLAEAGYPDGFEFDLWYMPVPRPYMPKGKLIGQAIQSYLKDINVTGKLITYDWSTYLAKIVESEDNEAETYLQGWTGDNGDPDNFLYALWDKNTSNNNYKSEELHEILVEAQQMTDKAKRIELYKKAQEIIHEDLPAIWLVHSTPPIAAKEIVKNYIPSPTTSELLDNVWLDK